MRSRKILLSICIMSIIIVLAACSKTPAAGYTAKPVEPKQAEVQTDLPGTGNDESTKAAADAGKQKDESSVIMGEWTVSKRLQTQNITAVSDEEFDKNYLNKKAVYTTTAAQFGEDICRKPLYEVEQMSAEQFAQGYRGATFKQLGIEADNAMVVQVTDSEGQWLSPGGAAIVKDENTLISWWDGAFFEMIRIK